VGGVLKRDGSLISGAIGKKFPLALASGEYHALVFPNANLLTRSGLTKSPTQELAKTIDAFVMDEKY